MDHLQNNDGIITSCKFLSTNFFIFYFYNFFIFPVIRLYRWLDRRGLYVRIDAGIGMWDIVPISSVTMADYFNLILVNGGRSHAERRSSRSRSPLARRPPSPESPDSPSPYSNGVAVYSPFPSRSSSPLYSMGYGDGDDSILVINSDTESERGQRSPPLVPPLPTSPPPPPSPTPPIRHSSYGLRNLCSICIDSEAFTNVTFKKCWHMICEDCLWELVDHGGDVKCPQCRGVEGYVIGRIQ